MEVAGSSPNVKQKKPYRQTDKQYLFQREIEALEGYIKLYWHTVVKLVRALYYSKEGCAFDPKMLSLVFFVPTCRTVGPWVDSASNRYE